jgi:hypothetical protein
MRWRALIVGLLMAVTLAARPAAAEDSAVATPNRVQLDYVVYFGGFRVVQLAIDLGMGSAAYDVTARATTVGMADWLARWTSVSRTEGAVAGLRLVPEQHRVQGELRGKHRSVSMMFTNGNVTAIDVMPAARDDYGRDEVPPEKRVGSLDPASALLTAVRWIAERGSCAERVPVFDGRRRYDVVAVDRGVEMLAANDYNSFSGPAFRCDFTIEPIAGYDQRWADEEMRKRRFRKGRAWAAELLPGQPVIPVRIELDGEMASALIHLTDVRRAVAAQDHPTETPAQ